VSGLEGSVPNSDSTLSGSLSLSESAGILAGFKGSDPAVVSLASEYPSLSSSVSALSPIPSLSLSEDSLASKGKVSSSSLTPSLSSSESITSAIPSPSVSPGAGLATRGSVPLVSSSSSL
jgi:hypothetical protein